MSKRTKSIVCVEWVTLVVNTLLTVFKFIAGFFGNSMAMIADAIHSLSDSVTTIAVMIGVKAASKDQDAHHQYGHEKIESFVSIIVATILGCVAVTIFVSGIQAFIDYFVKGIRGNKVTYLALIAAIISIVVKEILYFYAIIVAKKENSPALRADAWHHQSDCLSSIGSLIGILIAILTGFYLADAIASLIIGIFILKVAYNILKESYEQIVDASVSKEILDQAIEIIMAHEEVISIDSLKSRKHSTKLYFDLEIGLSENLSFVQAHAIAEAIHHELEEKIANVKHCTVHANPVKLEE